MFRRAAPLSLLVLMQCTPLDRPPRKAHLEFAVSFPQTVESVPLDGRLLVILAEKDEPEPRFQVSDRLGGQQVFGVDVDGLAPGGTLLVDGSAMGYPRAGLADVPPGEYWVQAVLHRYETFRRGDGHFVKMPMDRGEGQHWNKAPGNLLSTPKKLRVDPFASERIAIVLDQKVPAIPPPEDTKYIKHVRIQSELLTRFWGRPMYLGACVLLPEGFDEHPEARYPLVVNHGHFPHTFSGFREEPPDPDLEPDYSERFRLAGYNRIQQEMAYELYKTWISKTFPRLVIIEIQHANPFYDDSYAVNSANLGPYGDAIMHELIPFVENRFRCIGEGWARFTYGGSTGGWEALAAQIFYPDAFNGCFAACPDPIDFRAYTVVNIYEDKNAYWREDGWKRVPRPGHRNWLGHLDSTLEQVNRLELVLGTKGRSGQQWDIWEAVFSPCGPDGYPARIWDKSTGEIHPGVASYWRDHYDLRYILERDWAELGPKLRGKIHIYCGTMDNYYLNNAVVLMEEFLKKTKNPPFEGVVAYGHGAEHCWNGDPERPNAISRLRYHVMYVDAMLERMRKTAPPGADLTSWRY